MSCTNLLHPVVSDLDPYEEDKAEIAFLETKPLSFIVLGKPGSGKTQLAAKLASHWQCPFIHGEGLIKEAMLSGSDVGRQCANLLLSGEPVTDEIVYTLLLDKIASNAVANLGYVVEGPPCLSTAVSVKHQLDCLRESPLPPHYIINIRIPDEDLETRRVNQRIDPMTGTLYTKQIYDPDPIIKQTMTKEETNDEGNEENDEEEKVEEDAVEGEIEPTVEMAPLDTAIKSRLIQREEDKLERVKHELDLYHKYILPYLKDFISTHDQLRVIEVDGNKPLDALFNELVRRVGIYSLHGAIAPVRLMAPESEEREKVEDEEEEEEGAGKSNEQKLLEKAMLASLQPSVETSRVKKHDDDDDEEGDNDKVHDDDAMEDKEVYDIEDSDELLRTVAGQQTVSSRYRWKRSRWNRLCPVELRNCSLVPGKAEYAVGFLDKMYILSSEEAMNKFLLNPRPYLLPPQPRIPCKLFVVGPPYSGKTTLCRKIANKYSAKVIDMNEVLKRETERLREKKYGEIKTEVIRVAKEMVIEQLRMTALGVDEDGEEAEAYKIKITKSRRFLNDYLSPLRKKTYENSFIVDANNSNSLDPQKGGADNQGAEDYESRGSRSGGDSPSGDLKHLVKGEVKDYPDVRGISPDGEESDEVNGEEEGVEEEEQEEEQLFEVTDDNTDVQAIVFDMLADIDPYDIKVTVELERWVECLMDEIESHEQQMRIEKATNPMYGGWIIDNYPVTKEAWSVLFELNRFVPDQVIMLDDSSESEREILVERWFTDHRKDLEAREKQRLMEERELWVEAQRIREEQEQQSEIEEEEEEEVEDAKPEEATDRIQRAHALASVIRRESATLDEFMVTDVFKAPLKKKKRKVKKVEEWWRLTADVEGDGDDDIDDDEEESVDINDMKLWPGPDLPDLGDLDIRRELQIQYKTNWATVHSMIEEELDILVVSIVRDSPQRQDGTSGLKGSEGVQIVQPLTIQELACNVLRSLKKPVSYEAWVRTETDEQEEEEGEDDDMEEEMDENQQESEEEQEEGTSSRLDIRKAQGDTGHYCPVALKDLGVLWPGDQECSAKYREKIYYFSDEAARDKFIEYPKKYLAKNSPNPTPALRLLTLGPVGSGKTLHGRQAAERLGIFHIDFRERLQELVIRKTKRKVGAEFDDLEEDPQIDELLEFEEEEDEEVTSVPNQTNVEFMMQSDIDLNALVQQGVVQGDGEALKSDDISRDGSTVVGSQYGGTRERILSVDTGSVISARSAKSEASAARSSVTGAVPARDEVSMEHMSTVPDIVIEQTESRSPLRDTDEYIEISPEELGGTQLDIQGEEGEEGEEEEAEEVESLPHEASDELTADEQAIVDYLESDEPLPEELLVNLLNQWWQQEPFKSTGFILEGFPSTDDEAQILIDSGFYPDAAVVLDASEDDVIARLLPSKLARWREKRDRRLEHRSKVKEAREIKRLRAIQKRRKELLIDLNRRRLDLLTMKNQQASAKAMKASVRTKPSHASNISNNADNGDVISQHHDDVEEEEDGHLDDDEGDDVESLDMEQEMENIDAIIAEEYPEDDDDEGVDEETEEEARERITSDLVERYEKSSSGVADVKEKLQEFNIKVFNVDASHRRPHIIRYTMNKKLRPILEQRRSLFERVYPIGEKLAIHLLKTGYRLPSRFGRWCPVKLQEGDWMPPIYKPGVTSSYPAIYRKYIYFFSSNEAREQFRVDPLRYLQQPSPKPHVPIRIAIVGPPKSGKTKLAKRFVKDFGCMRISIGEALRTLLSTQPKTALANQIREQLELGQTVRDDLAVQALQIALMDATCHERGYVLDGYPISVNQAKLMEELNIVPVRMIELVVESKELSNRATLDRHSLKGELPLHDSAEIFGIKLAAWRSEVIDMRQWYIEQHDNWTSVDGGRSQWWVWNKTLEVARDSTVQVATYLERTKQGKAASLAGMCITPSEFKARLGQFGYHCPVSLAECQLVDNSHNPSLLYSAEYQGRYYKLAGAVELDKFLSHPDKYIPPLAPRPLPPEHLLPKRISSAEVRQMFPAPLQLHGYCPVTFQEGKQRYEAIVPGNPEIVALYKGKIFYFESLEKLDMFMRRPHRYFKLKLPHKLPPKKEPMSVSGLPMLGYLEQTVADAIIKSLLAVGTAKPKFPFVNATRSALVYMAFHMKANNPNSPEYTRKKFAKKLQQFEESCSLIGYLSRHMTKRYKDTGDRPIDFDFKLNKFIGYSQQSPEAAWVS